MVSSLDIGVGSNSVCIRTQVSLMKVSHAAVIWVCVVLLYLHTNWRRQQVYATGGPFKCYFVGGNIHFEFQFLLQGCAVTCFFFLSCLKKKMEAANSICQSLETSSHSFFNSKRCIDISFALLDSHPWNIASKNAKLYVNAPRVHLWRSHS